jgi:hypothetical protein
MAIDDDAPTWSRCHVANLAALQVYLVDLTV